MKNANKENIHSIVLNKKASHDYFIEERVEAGIALEGWEVKSLRAKKVQLNESYVLIKNREAWLLGSHITPLPTASTHKPLDPTRTRKLLLHEREISSLIGAIERKGYTVVPLSMYWKSNRVKVAIGVARGKQKHDKRATEKERAWLRSKQRVLKTQKR